MFMMSVQFTVNVLKHRIHSLADLVLCHWTAAQLQICYAAKGSFPL